MLEPLLLAGLLLLGQADGDDDFAEVEEITPAPVAVEEEEDEVPVPGRRGKRGVALTDYQLAQVERVAVADGRTRVSAEAKAPAPRQGSFPVRFFIDNSEGPRQVIQLSVRASTAGAFHTVSRSVEVNPGERRTVNVPVPAEMRYGSLFASGPGITRDANASMNFEHTYDPQRVVLSLSQPEAFEKFIGRRPRYSGANVLVHAVPPEEAPAELASYLGYDAVVVPDGELLERLDEAQRRAVEAYLATGGHLLVGGAVRSPALFPLLQNIRPGMTPYGFGKLFVSPGAPTYGQEVFRPSLPVSPHGALPEYERRYNRNKKSTELLLPQATAPLGRFLLIITLFALAIGPGSVWIARRRGPAALLVTIPGTAIVTCVLIIGYSVVADGFTVHTSTYGFTLLDSREHRAITQGVTAYYANLAPSKATLPPGTVLVAPHEDRRDKYIADLTWSDGLTLGPDFVPSRTYREWGFVAVEPTRARLVVKHKGEGWVAQNALGLRVDKVVVNVDGKFFTASSVRDGGEASLSPGNTLSFSGSRASTRFSEAVFQAVAKRPLQHREFLARVTDETLVPTGGLSTQNSEAEQWIRGEFEE